MTAYFALAALWFIFVSFHQHRRYHRKRPYFVDTLVEHFLLFPIGIALYVWSGVFFAGADEG